MAALRWVNSAAQTTVGVASLTRAKPVVREPGSSLRRRPWVVLWAALRSWSWMVMGN